MVYPWLHTSTDMTANRALCPVPVRLSGRQVPRAPLPTTGVTPCGMTSRIMSEDITPPLSLLRAHGPDQNPPTSFRLSLVSGSLQVVTSPCREMALPDIISAILA
jgi:hypothetical protein